MALSQNGSNSLLPFPGQPCASNKRIVFVHVIAITSQMIPLILAWLLALEAQSPKQVQVDSTIVRGVVACCWHHTSECSEAATTPCCAHGLGNRWKQMEAALSARHRFAGAPLRSQPNRQESGYRNQSFSQRSCLPARPITTSLVHDHAPLRQ